MKLARPIIAINCDYDPGLLGLATLRMPYIESVTLAGGLPLLVPPSPADVLKDYLALADGILFTGGSDYPPEFYGQKPHPRTEVQPSERADSDRRLMRLVLKSSKPALGICAGLQLLNIASGGALIQHLPNASKHRAIDDRDSSHPMQVLPKTQLSRLFGAGTIQVNSSHHQAADPLRVGRNLKISAKAPDGTIEGLELARPNGRFFICVQWHPERIKDAKHRRKLFNAFINACREKSHFS